MKRITCSLFLASLPLLTAAAPRVLGADENGGPTGSVTPIIRFVTVSDDEHKFREDQWIRDDWSGGIEEATLQHAFGEGWQFRADGRAVFDESDYRIRLEVAQPEVGFLRVGFEDFVKYFDDSGLFYSLNRDLDLEIGRFYVEAGLTLPDWPKLILGYEHQFKDGEKSLLEWGAASIPLPAPFGSTRNVYPSWKEIDETVDVFRFEIDHTIENVHVADQFRYERHSTETRRHDRALAQTTTVAEDYDHDAIFNTLIADTHLTEEFYLSFGYLFSTLEGDGSFGVDTTPNSLEWFTRALEVEQDSHVINLNLMAGPFAGLVGSLGIQAEYTETDGLTDLVLREIAGSITNSPAALIDTNAKKTGLEETLGVRYTKIPWTTLYAEATWQQQQIDQLETETRNAAAYLSRDTDGDIFRQDYRVGFNTSPMRRVNLAGRYTHRIHENDYDHNVDSLPGYPAFITAQDFTSDEVMAKITVRPLSKLSLSLQWQWVQTDVDTTTDSFALFGVPGGKLESGEYDAMIYSGSVTWTPLARLYLTGLVSYQDTETSAFANSSPAVTAYEGDVLTVAGAAGYALDEKTDLTVEYSYSQTDNFTNDFTNGLPLGLENQRHGLILGLSRELSETVTARIRYGYYAYNEDSNFGLDDFTAHVAAASCTVKF